MELNNKVKNTHIKQLFKYAGEKWIGERLNN